MKNPINETVKIYLLSDSAKIMTWGEWLKIKGCHLSGNSTANVAKAFRVTGKEWNNLTLGQIQNACIVAGREIAGFSVRHLSKPDMSVLEYDFSISRNRILTN